MNDTGDELQRIWDDQRAFNLLFRNEPTDHRDMALQARDMLVDTTSELHELIRTLPWKKHRRVPFKPNTAHTMDEAADVLKCVISLLQIVGVKSIDDLVRIYWEKTQVVRQRYREEWTNKLDGPCAIIDIDNVLCDYPRGICDWLLKHEDAKDLIALVGTKRVRQLRETRGLINAKSLGVDESIWQAIKSTVRTTGVKRTLPVFRDARIFLKSLRAAGLRIVLLTSRPVDQYPNILTDTLIWLDTNQLPFDYLWWSGEKAERILQIDGIRPLVKMVVDDDPKFIAQFSKAEFENLFLLDRHNLSIDLAPMSRVSRVHRLIDIPVSKFVSRD